MAPSSRSILGTAGEAAASAWLEAHGYKILDQNVRTRFGEIDLVARIGDVIVFVEVKSRTSGRFGHPAEAITAVKQHRLTRLASSYLHMRGQDTSEVRFDAIAVHFNFAGRVIGVEHIPDAFYPQA